MAQIIEEGDASCPVLKHGPESAYGGSKPGEPGSNRSASIRCQGQLSVLATHPTIAIISALAGTDFQHCDFIRPRVQGEVPGGEHVDFCFRYVGAVTLGLADVERKIVLAPQDQQPRL